MADPVVAAAPVQETPKPVAVVKEPVVAAPPPVVPVKEPVAPPAVPDKTLLGAEGEKKPEVVEPAKADYSKLKLPDGALITAAEMDAVKAYAEKHKLSPEAAQEAVDARAGSVKSYHDGLIEGHKATVEGWKKAVQDNPKFGGANIKATDQAVTSVLKKYAPEGFQSMLQDAGYAWHPGLVEFLHRVHEATKDDTFVKGDGKPAPQSGGLESMYKTKK